jgi:hypothetical protein
MLADPNAAPAKGHNWNREALMSLPPLPRRGHPPRTPPHVTLYIAASEQPEAARIA